MADGSDVKTPRKDLAREREKYRSSFEQCRYAIIFYEAETFQDCNSVALEMFRVPDLAIFETLHPGDLSPPHQPDGRPSREAANDYFNAALSCGHASFEWQHRTLDGVEFPAEILLNRVDLRDGPLIQAMVRDISDRKELLVLRAREQQLAEAQRLAHLGSWTLDFGINDIQWSDEVYRIFGLEQGEWDVSSLPPETTNMERTLRWAHPTWAVDKIENNGMPTATKEGSWQGDTALLDHEGKEIPYSQVIIVHRDAAGVVNQTSTFLHDISSRKELENRIKREKAFSESILAGLPGIFYIYDKNGHLVQWNDRMEAVTGRSPEELDGIDLFSLIPAEEKDKVATAIAQAFSQGASEVESMLCTVEGNTPYLFNGLRVELEGDFYLLGIGLDITKQKRFETLLKQEASTDHLTGLHNRQHFDAQMERALAHHKRYGSQTALVIADLDHFKHVNDTYGHDVGDRVLVELSERVAKALREPDFLARWGGEEFTAILADTDPAGAARVAERLRQCIASEPFADVGRLTMSFGITNFQSADTPDTLLKRVDNALYEAKRVGRNRVVVNDEGLQSSIVGERRLKKALFSDSAAAAHPI